MVKLARDSALELDARRMAYYVINDSPGLHFREIQRRTGLAYGNLQYHLEFLVKHGLIVEEKGTEYSRFFTAHFRSLRERELISLLRQESIRRILLHLLETPGSRNRDIVAGVGLSASTVSWHMGRLLAAGAVTQERRENDTVFRVSEPEVVTQLLVTYKAGFIDAMVDRFVDLWERENIRQP
jgi:predicted transcriptional regulator